MTMSTNKPNAETHYQCKEIAKERDTYRDLCAELKEVLRNHYWNDCTKHSKEIETLITKAETILGEKNGTGN